MTLAVVQGALAVNFAVSDKPMVITSTKPVLANGGIAAIMASVNNQSGSNGRSTLQAGVHHAELGDVCVRVSQSVLGNPFTLVVKAGSGLPGSVTANQLVADAEALTGKARLEDGNPADATPVATAVGLDAGSLNPGTDLVDGNAGDFGLRTNADATVENLRAEAAAATVGGAITLENLDIAIRSGDQTSGQTC